MSESKLLLSVCLNHTPVFILGQSLILDAVENHVGNERVQDLTLQPEDDYLCG